MELWQVMSKVAFTVVALERERVVAQSGPAFMHRRNFATDVLHLSTTHFTSSNEQQSVSQLVSYRIRLIKGRGRIFSSPSPNRGSSVEVYTETMLS